MWGQDYSFGGRLRYLAVAGSLGVILAAWLLTSHVVPALDQPFAANPGGTLLFLAMPGSAVALFLIATVRMGLFLVLMAMHAAGVPRRYSIAFALRCGLVTPEQVRAGDGGG